ncbi:hypothetical protein FB451DRAFT_1373512 [Mycena latifolia]|nr:hypothetical protein FB451DRAFT_1373512 [Mycena latifolia]
MTGTDITLSDLGPRLEDRRWCRKEFRKGAGLGQTRDEARPNSTTQIPRFSADLLLILLLLIVILVRILFVLSLHPQSPSCAAAATAYADNDANGILLCAGRLTLSATYLTTPAFRPESLEALLSSRFTTADSDTADTRACTRYAGEGSMQYGGEAPTVWERPDAHALRDAPAPARPHLHQRSQEQDEDEDTEFMPTLARRTVTGSASTASSLGMGAGAGAGAGASPGRYTSPLPPSPGRYTTPLPVSPSPGRYTSAFQARARADSQSQAAYRGGGGGGSESPAPSYRMGVDVAGFRRDVGAVGKVADRFVLPRSGVSSWGVHAERARAGKGKGDGRADWGWGWGGWGKRAQWAGWIGRGSGSGVGAGGTGGVSGSGPSAIAINRSKKISRASTSLRSLEF